MTDHVYTVPALGSPIPDAPHAVSVAMPTWADVVGYEEGDPRVLQALACGYPRFVFHPRVRALFAAAEARLAEPGEKALVLPSAAVADRCLAFLAANGVTARRATFGDLTAVLVPETAMAMAKRYWQHTGEIVSSRRADAALAGRGDHAEAAEAKAALRQRLANLASTPEEAVFLFPSGMAAMAQALRLIQHLHPARATVQLGFPYIDSLKLQERLGSGCAFYPVAADANLQDLELRLANGDIGGVFVEMPSNPLMRSVDLARLARSTRAAGVPLVIDDSVATFYNHDWLPYADILVSSLTKYFAGHGEAMGGVLIVNPASPFRERFQTMLAAEHEDLLWGEDAVVILGGAADFEARMQVINRNAERLANALSNHPAVARVYYPTIETPGEYRLALRPQGGFGGMLSLLLVDPERTAPAFYDRLQVDKGPSFGLHRTLACPYTLLAHFTELDWAESCGVSRHLIRVSVGLEDETDLLHRFTSALEAL
jgi:cystathionine gamma-synthase